MSTQEDKIFNKYNPASEVKRCPYGFSPLRDMLSCYAQAAVNLYGVISKADLVEIFNNQYTRQTTEEELYSLLLPVVLKQKYYCFYKEYVVHISTIADTNYIEDILKNQREKQRYLPDKDEFLKHVDETYLDETELPFWYRLDEYISKNSQASQDKRYELIGELRTIALLHILKMDFIFELLREHNITFKNEMQLEQFMDLFMKAYNNTRTWFNNGYSPANMKYKQNISPHPKTEPSKKVGPNEPCPCGSGKKYKKCCGRVGKDT